MPDVVVEFLKDINIVQLVAIGVILWFFYSRLDSKIEKLGEKVEDVDRRLCRIEGSLASQGHCLFSQKEGLKKAE